MAADICSSRRGNGRSARQVAELSTVRESSVAHVRCNYGNSQVQAGTYFFDTLLRDRLSSSVQSHWKEAGTHTHNHRHTNAMQTAPADRRQNTCDHLLRG